MRLGGDGGRFDAYWARLWTMASDMITPWSDRPCGSGWSVDGRRRSLSLAACSSTTLISGAGRDGYDNTIWLSNHALWMSLLKALCIRALNCASNSLRDEWTIATEQACNGWAKDVEKGFGWQLYSEELHNGCGAV
jgi:hypothetical protein